MGNKVEYKRDATPVTDGSTDVDWEDDEVRPGWKLTIQHLSLEDQTTAFTEVRIGYKDERDRYHWWVEQESPQAGVLYWMDKPKVLTEGMILVVRFTGTTSGDVLKVYVDGFEEKVSP